MLLPQPWLPAAQGGFSEIMIERAGREPEVPRVPATTSPAGYEIDAVARQIEQREAREMSLADSLGNARALDRWRQAVGETYAADAPQP